MSFWGFFCHFVCHFLCRDLLKASMSIVSRLVCLSVSGMSVVDALKQFLSTFKLPGESQQIERIMEAFAHRYYKDQIIVSLLARHCRRALGFGAIIAGISLFLYVSSRVSFRCKGVCCEYF